MKKGKGKGKGKARARNCGSGTAQQRGSGGRVRIRLVRDQFDASLVAVGSDDEVEDGEDAAGDGGAGRGPSTRRRETRGREAAAAAAEVLKVDRNTLECALCHKGNSPEHPLPGRVVGDHPVMEGTKPVWVHDGCALYSPMVVREDKTDALCNIASEVGLG